MLKNQKDFTSKACCCLRYVLCIFICTVFYTSFHTILTTFFLLIFIFFPFSMGAGVSKTNFLPLEKPAKVFKGHSETALVVQVQIFHYWTIPDAQHYDRVSFPVLYKLLARRPMFMLHVFIYFLANPRPEALEWCCGNKCLHSFNELSRQ